jgi:hypothetical protein
MKVLGNNREFECTGTTRATGAQLWDAWMDVSTWKRWDRGLKDAHAPQTLALGVKGVIVPLRGLDTTFEVTEFDAGRHYTFCTNLIAAKLYVRRSFVSQDPTVFRHQVWFSGPLGALWARLLGPGFRRAIPLTMATLADVAAQPGAKP